MDVRFSKTTRENVPWCWTTQSLHAVFVFFALFLMYSVTLSLQSLDLAHCIIHLLSDPLSTPQFFPQELLRLATPPPQRSRPSPSYASLGFFPPTAFLSSVASALTLAANRTATHGARPSEILPPGSRP